MNSLLDDFFTYVGQTSEHPMALSIDRGQGAWLYGPEGEQYLDFISGICVSNLGHGDPDILQAIWEQARKYLHPIVYGEGVFSPQVLYAKALAQALAPPLDYVYFTNSGAEAIEASLKIAKKYTGRKQLIACHNAYHGSTHGALSVSGDPRAKVGYGPLLPEVYHIRYNHRTDLEKITEETAAFILEPIQGAGGVVVPDPGYLSAVRARCEETGTLLILDEIQTGFGRTGSLFAHQTEGIVPDILILAKALGGGLPLGAVVSSPKILSVIQRSPPLGHISTFGGHPVSCAAGMALFNKIQKGPYLPEVKAREALLKQSLIHPQIAELRGRGLLYALLFHSEDMAKLVLQECLKRGLITIGFLSEPRGLRISPPLNISLRDLEWGIETILAAIDKVQ